MNKQDQLQGLTIIVALLAILTIPTVIPGMIQNLLELVVFVASLILAWQSWQLRKFLMTILFLLGVILFNPISLLVFNLQSWFFLDIVYALALFVAALCLNGFRSS